MFVNSDQPNIILKHWKNKFFESMGGKSHIRCQCNAFPLIPSNKKKTDKLHCNASAYFDSNNAHIQHVPSSNCNYPESYVCSNIHCRLRICNRCYRKFSTDCITTFIPDTNTNRCNIHNNPSENISNDTDDENNSIHSESISSINSINSNNTPIVHENTDHDKDDTMYDNISISSSTTLNVNVNVECTTLNNKPSSDALFSDYVIFPVQDTSLNLTSDNNVMNEGFFTTNSANISLDVKRNSTDTNAVSGHVIFNQIGNCAMRKTRNINGTSRQKHMIQSLCASTPNQSHPLLQPEASLFPRHFYISASNDLCATLGAQPLFLLTPRKNKYGFTSILTQARIHMTNPFSTTSTDPNLMCYYFDTLENIVLGKSYSRDIFERGFVVDDKSAYGMSVRDKNHTELVGSVDSR